jgi:ubiquinone/menaquinone biosynthesis C-methylase UbiE
MRIAVLDFLRCPDCASSGRGLLHITKIVDETLLSGRYEWPKCKLHCVKGEVSQISGDNNCVDCARTDIINGILVCADCNREYQIQDGIPLMFVRNLDEINKTDSITESAIAQMEFYDDTALIYEERWVSHPRFEMHYKKSVQNLMLSLGSTQIAIDIGCGTGKAALSMAQNVQHVVGVDISFNLLRVAKRKISRKKIGGCIDLIQGNATALPIASSFFDLGSYWGVLHHILPPDLALNEARRVIVDSGVLSASEPNSKASTLPWKIGIILNLFPAVINRLTKRRLKLDEYEENDVEESTFTLTDLIDTIRNAGFEILKSTSQWFFAIIPLDYPPRLNRQFYRILSFLDDRYSKKISQNELGGELFVIARKKHHL